SIVSVSRLAHVCPVLLPLGCLGSWSYHRCKNPPILFPAWRCHKCLGFHSIQALDRHNPCYCPYAPSYYLRPDTYHTDRPIHMDSHSASQCLHSNSHGHHLVFH